MEDSLITSVRVHTTPSHDRVSVWNRGGNAGTMTVQRHDGERVAMRLLADDAEPYPMLVVEERDGTRTFQRAPTDGLEIVIPQPAAAPSKADEPPPPRIGR